MNHSIRVGFSFGLTTGIITTLGLMVGLYSSTGSTAAVIGGILIIAIADALADSMGIHMSEESENRHTSGEIWTSTFSTFFTKFLFTLSFLVPVLIFDLNTAILVSIAWGLLSISLLSYTIARRERAKPWRVIGEHILLTIIVIFSTYVIGSLINSVFG